MRPTSDFDFHRAVPAAPLRAFVESIWAVRGTAPYRRSSVLPNGALQLMINFGAPHRVLAFGETAAQRRFGTAWIAGLQDAPLAIEAPPATDLLAIRFRPGGAHAFLPVPLDALTNDVVDADAVLGAAAGELRERLALAPTRAAQVATVERWLLARCRPREREFALVGGAVAALSRCEVDGRRVGVAAACERAGLSNRSLIRLFRRYVGLAPKTYARVHRFHRALGELPAACSLADLALELGYADQAHFGNEFRRLAGVTPGAYLARRGADDESVVLG
jgi:AraC-like DNA-binding protein